MAVIKELIRKENDGTLSFGNFEFDTKQKKSDFEYEGDLYKVKTFKEITKLEKNGFMTTYTKEYQGRKRKYYFHAGNSYQKRFRQKRQNLLASLLKNG